jgi:DNA-binding HxlR family transcriptional regulator
VKRTPFRSWPCSIARTIDLLGDWWTPLVLREAFYGTKRFDDFQRVLGIGRNILTQRLNRLVQEGIFERVPYQERPVRYEYLLTAKGRELFPVLAAINSWGDRWLASEAGIPVVLHHTSCDHDSSAVVVCSHCRAELELPDVEVRLGPGFPDRHRPAALATGRFTESANDK